MQRGVIFPLLISGLSASFMPGNATAKADAEAEGNPEGRRHWEVVSFGGVDYVSLGNIQKFYRFDSPKAEGLVAPLDSLEPPADAEARVFLRFQPTDGPPALSTEVFRAAGTDGDGHADEEAESLPANQFDALNLMVATAFHSHLIARLQPMEDLGIRRGDHEDLATASVPATRITFSVPEGFGEWDEVTEALVEAARRSQSSIRSK